MKLAEFKGRVIAVAHSGDTALAPPSQRAPEVALILPTRELQP